MLLAHYLADIRDGVSLGHEINHVVQFQFVITTRYDCVVTTLHGHHMIWSVRLAEFFQRLVKYLCCLAHLDTKHHKGAVMYIPTLAHPTHLQSVTDVYCRQMLRINKRVDTHLLEERLVVLFKIFILVNFGNSFLRAKRMSHHATRDIQEMVGSDGNEQVGIAYTCLLQSLETGRRGKVCHQVIIATDTSEAHLAVVYQHRVVVASRQQLCQMCSYGVSANNDYIHYIRSLGKQEWVVFLS